MGTIRNIVEIAQQVLFVFLTLFIFTGIPAAILGFVCMWQQRHIDNVIKYKALLMGSIAIYFIGAIIASVHDTPHLTHNTWFWVWYLPVTALLVACMWLLDLCLMGYIDRGGKKRTLLDPERDYPEI